MDRVEVVADRPVTSFILLISILMKFSTCFLAVMTLALEETILDRALILAQTFLAQVQMVSMDFLVQVSVLADQASVNRPVLALREIKMGRF